MSEQDPIHIDYNLDPIHIDYNLDPDLDPSWKNQIQVINISSRFTFFVQLKQLKFLLQTQIF